MIDFSEGLLRREKRNRSWGLRVRKGFRGVSFRCAPSLLPLTGIAAAFIALPAYDGGNSVAGDAETPAAEAGATAPDARDGGSEMGRALDAAWMGSSDAPFPALLVGAPYSSASSLKYGAGFVVNLSALLGLDLGGAE